MFRSISTVIFTVFMLATLISAFCHGASLGEVGTLIAVERVFEDDCDDFDDDGKCAYEAISSALRKLESHMNYFRCVSASSKPNIVLSPRYEAFSKHDPGPVVMVEARDLRCKIDPRGELRLVEEWRLEAECSRLTWKCDVIWRPDYDVTTLLIGRISR